jgi:hypothetical protein
MLQLISEAISNTQDQNDSKNSGKSGENSSAFLSTSGNWSSLHAGFYYWDRSDRA